VVDGARPRDEASASGIPAMARSGSIDEMPLRGLGIHNFYLRLHVLVEPHATDERR
jgi:hypothetical protein